MSTKVSLLRQKTEDIKRLYVEEDMGLHPLSVLLSRELGVKISVGALYYFIHNELGISKSVQEACYKRRKISDEELVDLHVVQGLNAPAIAKKAGMSRVSVWARLGSIGKGGNGNG